MALSKVQKPGMESSVPENHNVEFLGAFKRLECGCCNKLVGLQHRVTGVVLCDSDFRHHGEEKQRKPEIKRSSNVIISIGSGCDEQGQPKNPFNSATKPEPAPAMEDKNIPSTSKTSKPPMNISTGAPDCFPTIDWARVLTWINLADETAKMHLVAMSAREFFITREEAVHLVSLGFLFYNPKLDYDFVEQEKSLKNRLQQPFFRYGDIYCLKRAADLLQMEDKSTINALFRLSRHMDNEQKIVLKDVCPMLETEEDVPNLEQPLHITDAQHLEKGCKMKFPVQSWLNVSEWCFYAKRFRVLEFAKEFSEAIGRISVIDGKMGLYEKTHQVHARTFPKEKQLADQARILKKDKIDTKKFLMKYGWGQYKNALNEDSLMNFIKMQYEQAVKDAEAGGEPIPKMIDLAVQKSDYSVVLKVMKQIAPNTSKIGRFF